MSTEITSRFWYGNLLESLHLEEGVKMADYFGILI